MLIGRSTERARIAELLTAAAQGRSGVLVLHGESGAGKSALLADAAHQAGTMLVLRATCAESESEIAFSGLADLLRPALDRLPSVPEPQAAALASVLALGPPAPADRFTYCAATLSLLAAAAEDQGVLAIVDDAQWMDSASLDAVLFAARRLHAEGVVVLLGVRDDDASRFDRRGLPELVVDRLDRKSGLELLHREFDIAGATGQLVFAGVGGNPLALLESARLLTPGQRAGVEPLADPLQLGASVRETFLRQLGAVSTDVRHALLCAAASGNGELEPIVRAARSLGLPTQALESAESLGFLTVDGGTVRFRHPALRSAIYHSASPGMRRSVHRALADALGQETDTDRLAWHLAAAALGPDEPAAAALEATASRARSRAGYVAAALALQRAAGLSALPEDQLRRLVAGSEAARLAGRSELAAKLAREALERTRDPIERSDINLMIGLATMWTGAPMAVHDLLVEQAGLVRSLDPARAAVLMAMAVPSCYMSGSLDRGLVTAREAHALAQQLGGFPEAVTGLQLAMILGLRGEVAESRLLMDRYSVPLQGGAFAWETAELTQLTAHFHIWTEQYETAGKLLVTLITRARGESVLSVLPYLLATLSELDFRLGRWAASLANATESLRLADELGQPSSSAFSAVCIARTQAARGNRVECAAHAHRALQEAGEFGIGSIFNYADSALALLHLGTGAPAAAIEKLERVARSSRVMGVGEPGVIQWAPDLIEAYVQVGRGDAAAAALSEFEQQAERTQRTGARAAAARCRGLVQSEDLGAFEEALALYRPLTAPFETARTQLCLAESLLRMRRRSEAQTHLEAAIGVFRQLGAYPWMERARRHLEPGVAVRRPTPHSVRLTPSELQVALVVAEGATNKEAAMRLFLSPKTVESHLSTVYAKLEIRSRSQLARLFAREQEHSGAA
ncbi:MAG: LuxR family transcriptional regulator [Candidatus Dormibacteria bacterium]